MAEHTGESAVILCESADNADSGAN
jgi:hypothetical protein